MKLKNQVFVIGLMLGIAFALILFGGHGFLLQGFVKLEQDFMYRNVLRVNRAFVVSGADLETLTTDWATWDDSYQFIVDRNTDFIKTNLVESTFQNAKLNLILYYDSTGKLVFGKAYDLALNKEVTIPKSVVEYMSNNKKLIHHASTADRISGVIKLPDGLMQIASSPIITSEKKGPIRGSVLMGRYLGSEGVQKIAVITELDLKLFEFNAIETDPLLSQVYRQLKTTNTIYIEPANNREINGYSLVKDVNGIPVAILKVTMPRSIFQTGKQVVGYYFASALLLSIVLIVFLWWLLRVIVVKRLEKLDSEIVAITLEKNFSDRVTVQGSDELTSVARVINGLLETLEEMIFQLKTRIKKGTAESRKLKKEIADREAIERALLMSQERLDQLAHYDTLTNLPNRLLFNELLRKFISEAKRQKKNLAVLFLDLDRFKNINDSFGHSIGDQVLKIVAERMRSVLRNEAIISRLGGDEFMVLINDVEYSDQVAVIARRILGAFVTPVMVGEHELYLNLSIGISIYPNDGMKFEDLEKNADMAMYRAKQSGGGTFHYYTREMNQAASKFIELETNLRKAVNNKEFVVYYQPKIDLKTREIVGAEALIRWNHPQLGFISPASFIPVAEETGLILSIGEFVLAEACRTAKLWQEQGLKMVPVAVNLSAVQFRNLNLVQSITTILSETGLTPEYLELEITESAVMENVNIAIGKLRAIREIGILVSVDDFGTGYSSISYLKQFPINYLKIDRSFVDGIPDNPDDVVIASAVISLAHSLGFKVIAEGVETQGQSQFLVESDCDMAQGYYFSRPVPNEEFSKLLIMGKLLQE